MQGAFRLTLDRLRQFVWCNDSQSAINSCEMFTIERVELRIIRRAVLGSKPPAPVAALGSQQRFLGLLQRLFARRVFAALLTCFFRFAVDFTRVPEQFPGLDILRVADPHIEVGIDPRSRKNSGCLWSVAGRGNGLARRQRPEIRVTLNPSIEFAQKFPAMPGIVFPSIFPIRNKHTVRGRLACTRSPMARNLPCRSAAAARE